MGKNLFTPGWSPFLLEEVNKPYMSQLLTFLEQELKKHAVAPPKDYFRSLKLTDYNQVQVVILGQDPYPTLGHANGLAFAVNDGVATPKSLQNIFKEISADLQVPVPQSNTLLGWADQGVLLLNTVLSCRVGEPMSHRNRGWEIFTDKVIWALNQRSEPVIFLLWGKPAQNKRTLITNSRHPVLMAAHPSPLSAHRGFLGCKHFSKVNKLLVDAGQKPINWTRTGK